MESQASTQIFTPIYGWGWRDKESLREVPQPFTVMVNDASESLLRGVVLAPHEFAGADVILELRSQDGQTRNWNVMVSSHADPKGITGFAESRQV
jgi:hypothetical protein